jgi:peptidoglycan hydrolase-like protein with peptidoglycan-binding domain
MKSILTTIIVVFLTVLLGAGVTFGQQKQEKKQDDAQLQISAEQLNSAQIRELQEALQEQGIDPGPVDGIMGSLTQQAIQLFQQQEGLAATGDINEQTLEALDIEVQEFMGLSPAFEEDQSR